MYTDFYFSDGQEGSYFLVLDVDPISSFINKVVPILIVLFLLAFIVTNGALTYFLSRNIIRPLNEMKEAANQIKEGNLAYSLKLGRKDELGELNESFEEMRIRLKESLETQLKYEENRKELISNISHDLKTPITAIKGYIEGIQDGVADSPEKRAKYLKTIHTKANHMDRLIDELLLFSKLDMNSIPFKFDKVNISQFIADLVEGLKLDLEKKEVALIIENKLLHETFVLVDREKFQRAMMNIVTNSIKFMDKEEKRIVISLTGDVDNVLIAIQDNGMGIKEHDLPRVIERFYRADSSRNTKLGGSGIGLAIVKQIIEAHHGSMEIESEYGVGTTIYLSLREWRVNVQKILIIEDEESIAELQRDYLEINGFVVDLAHDGSVGLEKALHNDYDLIVLDLMLPHINGFDICKQIRLSKEIPIIMVTARNEDIDVIRGLGLGADDYMTKPFSPNQFVARVKSQLARYNRLVNETMPKHDEIRIRNLVINRTSRKVYIHQNEVFFRTKEFDLLTYLATHPNQVLTKDDLFERIWGMEAVSDNATVTVHIGKIRDKIERFSPHDSYIETVWGVGYRFRA